MNPFKSQGIRIDTDIPGGNLQVDRVDGSTFFVRPDLRDTVGDWFYWQFRLRNAGGQTLNFVFPEARFAMVGKHGPAVSFDGRKTWQWAEPACRSDHSFQLALPASADDVTLCMTIPYLQANLDTWLAAHEGNACLRKANLACTGKGRPIEMLFAGNLSGTCAHRVLLTARHHCCESIASYILEGILDAVLTSQEPGAWLRQNVEFLAIPFMDKDGVEDGDQGKSRFPHDHNQDYTNEPIYPAVRALQNFVPTWGAGKLRLGLDLHCPELAGSLHEVIHFVGSADQRRVEHMQRFSTILESIRSGPLPYYQKNNLLFGTAWNTNRNSHTCATWLSSLHGAVGLSIETPYADASGTTITPENTRAFGNDLAQAICEYLKSLELESS